MKKIIFTIPLFLLSACANDVIKPISIDDYEKTYTVKTGNIYSNNKYVGTLLSDETSLLSFKLGGKIVSLYFKEGDFVKKGQVLAILDGNEIKTQYSSAKQMLESLNEMYINTEKMFDAQIKSMESKVEQAKKALEGLQVGVLDTQKIKEEQLLTSEKQVNQAKVALETAKTNLEHTKNILKQKEQNIYSNSKNAISQTKILFNNFFIFIDELFGISNENRTKNDAFEVYLSAKNSALKEEIKTLWLKLHNKYVLWKKNVDELLLDIKNSDSFVEDENIKNRIYETLQETQKLLIESRKLADKVFTAIDSSITSSKLTKNMINQYKQKINEFQNNIELSLLKAEGNFLLGIKGSIQNIENFKKQSKMELDLLQKKYELAKASYETALQMYLQYKASSNAKVNEVNTKYEVAKKQYEEALRALQALKEQKQSQLSQIKSQISQVRGNKNLAAVNLGNIKLYAPYSGVITKKFVNISQVVGAGTPIYELSNPNKLKGVFYVPVEELENISLGQKVHILALDKAVEGEIVNIYPSVDLRSKKVLVEVSIKDKVKDWIIGMYISGYPLKSIFTGLVVPHEFIYYEYGNAYVNKKTKNGYKKQNIKISKCDNNFCIVSEGLEVNDIIK